MTLEKMTVSDFQKHLLIEQKQITQKESRVIIQEIEKYNLYIGKMEDFKKYVHISSDDYYNALAIKSPRHPEVVIFSIDDWQSKRTISHTGAVKIQPLKKQLTLLNSWKEEIKNLITKLRKKDIKKELTALSNEMQKSGSGVGVSYHNTISTLLESEMQSDHSNQDFETIIMYLEMLMERMNEKIGYVKSYYNFHIHVNGELNICLRQ